MPIIKENKMATVHKIHPSSWRTMRESAFYADMGSSFIDPLVVARTIIDKIVYTI